MSAPYGGVPEWSNGADCKSVAFGLRWFKSTLPHQYVIVVIAMSIVMLIVFIGSLVMAGYSLLFYDSDCDDDF